MRQKFEALRRFALPALSASLLIAALYIPATGQSTRSISTTGRRIDEINKQVQKAERDELSREMRGERPSKEELKERAARKARITEDLEGLQTEYNRIAEKLNMREPVGSEFAAEAADRIHERASRLRHDLVFPEKVKDNGAEPTAEKTDTGAVTLRNLCLQIHAFITSPALENPSLVDIKETERTRDTLDRIIQISDELRRQHSKSE